MSTRFTNLDTHMGMKYIYQWPTKSASPASLPLDTSSGSESEVGKLEIGNGNFVSGTT